jgi:DNA recombination protein RmuC
MEKMGKKIDEAKTEYLHLESTRKNQLEKPLQKIENLRKQKGIPINTEQDEELPSIDEDQ